MRNSQPSYLIKNIKIEFQKKKLLIHLLKHPTKDFKNLNLIEKI